MWKCLKIATKMPWFNGSLKGRYVQICTNGHVERDAQTSSTPFKANSLYIYIFSWEPKGTPPMPPPPGNKALLRDY